MTLGFTLSFAAFATLACVAFSLWNFRTSYRDAQERVVSAADHLRIEWQGRTEREAFEEVHEDARLDEVAMLLIGREGRVLGRDGHPTLPWPLPSEDWIVRAFPDAKGTAAAGISWEPIAARLREETMILAAFALVATVGVGGAAWSLVGRTLRPIGRLADGADAASSDPLHARLASPSEDVEMTHLVATLNGLLGRLADSARNREEFYASAAHELRTPLAVLSAEVEVALTRSRSVAEHEETLWDVQAQIRRLTSLVEALLTLNRLEVGTRNEATETVDPADLADTTLAALDRTIRSRGLALETHWGRETRVAAPANHVGIVVRNLVENAVRYAPLGGRIEVVTGDTFRIANDLPPDAPKDLERMFEPFVQGNPARSGEGNGLGLAICRRVAVLNGWPLSLRREEDRIVAEIAFASSLETPGRIQESRP